MTFCLNVIWLGLFKCFSCHLVWFILFISFVSNCICHMYFNKLSYLNKFKDQRRRRQKNWMLEISYVVWSRPTCLWLMTMWNQSTCCQVVVWEDVTLTATWRVLRVLSSANSGWWIACFFENVCLVTCESAISSFFAVLMHYRSPFLICAHLFELMFHSTLLNVKL